MVRVLTFLFLASLGISSWAQDVKTFIPPRAVEHFPTLVLKHQQIHPAFPSTAYYASLIEHESCISLRHSRCWSPTSRLKTEREEGAGLGQLTRTWRADGTERFDTLADLRRRHREHLQELTWGNIYQRADLQIAAIVLLVRENYNALQMIEDEFERASMADSSYNRGLGNLRKDRMACGLAKGCDPQYWFDHIERYCVGANPTLYAGRTACQINRHHVHDVMKTRLSKYERALEPYLKVRHDD